MASIAPPMSSSSSSASSHRPSQSSSSSSSSSRPPMSGPSSSAPSSTPMGPPRNRNSTRQFEYTRECPNPWSITPAQLSASPSLPDGMSSAQVVLVRAETADFISQMGQQCKITQWAIATASVYLHVFFTRFSFQRFNRFEVAATCLFLAGKVEERRTRVDQVINAYYHVRLNPPPSSSSTTSSSSSSSSSSLSAAIHLLPPSPSSPEYEALRQRIYALEMVLLDATDFVFEIVHPYPNIMTYLREHIYGPKYASKPSAFIAKETQEKGGLAQIAWLFINDSLRSTLCLEYPPDVVCVAVIALSIKYKQLDEPVRAGPSVLSAKPWHEELFGVDKKTIDSISDVILTCVEQRYKPDPVQAQALLSSGATPPINTALPVTSLPTIPLTSGAASHNRPRPPPAGGPNPRSNAAPGVNRDRDAHPHYPSAPVPDTVPASGLVPMERVVPRSLQGTMGTGTGGPISADRKRGRFPVPSQPHAADHNASRPAPAPTAAPAQPSRAAQPGPPAPALAQPKPASAAPKRGGYVWKPPAKSRRPATAALEDAVQKPAAPTRPISPMTPPSPFLQQVSPSSRPPSPFLQSPGSASKRKRDDEPLVAMTASASAASAATPATRKRHHSPSPPRPHPTLDSTAGLARFDSHGQTESSLVEQIETHMRFQSAASGALEEGEIGGEKELTTFDMSALKPAPEEKEDVGGGVIHQYILQGLDVMKAGLRSEKRDDEEVMEDIVKMREEMDGEGPLHPRPAAPRHDDDDEDDLETDEGNLTDHEAAGGEGDGDGEGEGDCRVWKRVRREMEVGGQSPTTPTSPVGFEGMEGRGRGEEDGSDFDVSAPSSPHVGHDDGGVHHAGAFDSFSAVKPHSHSSEPLDDLQEKVDIDVEKAVTDRADHSTLLSV